MHCFKNQLKEKSEHRKSKNPFRMKGVGKTFKVILFIYALFEILIASGPLFGWTSLIYILRREGYYGQLCTEERQSVLNYTGSTNKSFTKPQPPKDRLRPTCPQQEQRLNGVYVIVVLTLTATVPAALITENYGPRVCRIISAVLFLISGVCWVSLTKDNPYLIYIASLSLAVGGVTSMFPMVQLSVVVYDKYKATVTGFEFGVKDASASMLLIFKLLYDAGVSLSFQWCLTIYCWTVALFSGLASFTLFPSKTEYDSFVSSSQTLRKANTLTPETGKPNLGLQLTDETSNNRTSYEAQDIVHNGFEKQEDREMSNMDPLEDPTNSLANENSSVKSGDTANSLANKNNFIESKDPANSQADESNSSKSEAHKNKLANTDTATCVRMISGMDADVTRNSVTERTESEAHLRVDNAKGKERNTNRKVDLSHFIDSQIHSNAKHIHLERFSKKQPAIQNNLLRLFFSAIFLWALWIVSFSMLRMYFYVSSFDNLILQQSSDVKVLSQYTNAFGIIQLLGIVFAPVVGPYLDGRLTGIIKTHKDREMSSDSQTFGKMKRYAIAFAVSNTAGIFLEAVSLIPILELQYMSMFCQVVLRALVLSINSSYLAVVMPMEHYGKFLSCVFIIGSTFSAIQYLLLEIMEVSLNGDPFWIHFGLLIISFTAYGQPIHCYLWTRRTYGSTASLKTAPEEEFKQGITYTQKL